MEVDMSLHTPLLCHQLGAIQEAHGLSLRTKVDPEGINSWKLSAKHTPSNWATSPSLKGYLSGYATSYLT